MNLKNYKYIFIIFISLIFIHSTKAQDTLELEENFTSTSLGLYISILEDKSAQLKISDVSQQKFQQKFKQYSDQIPGFGFTKSVFWIKFSLHNKSNNMHWILDQSFTNTNHLYLYIPNENLTNRFFEIKAGNQEPSQDFNVLHRRAIFKIELEKNQQKTYYLRMQNNASSKIALKLWDETEFAKYDRSESFAMGAFYGLLLVILLLNLILFLFFRISSYGYLAIFITFISVTYLFLDGYAQLFFPAYLLEMTQHFFHMSLALAMIGLLFFVKTMFNYSKNFKIFHNLVSTGWLLVFLLKPFSEFDSMVRFSIPLLLLTIIFLLSLSCFNWNNKKVIARLFVFAFVTLGLSYSGQALIAFGVIERSAFSEQGLRIALIILILIFSVSIIDHVQNINNIWKLTRKALKKSLHLQVQSEEKFTKSFYHLPVPMQIINISSFKRVAVNASFAELTGYTIDDIMGKKIFETNIVADPDAIKLHLKELVSQGEISNVPIKLIHKDESPVYTLASAVTLDIENELHAIVTFNNITDKRLRDNALQKIAMGVSSNQNEDFFNNLIIQLSKVFDANYVFLGLLDHQNQLQVNTHSICKDGIIIENFSYHLKDTPCENVVGFEMCSYPREVCKLFPKDEMLIEMGIESYIGTPLNDSNGDTFGIVVVLNKSPMENVANNKQILQIFASRAASEFENYFSEIQLVKAQQKLELHVQQTPLAVIEWNVDFEVVAWNPAAEKIFGYSEKQAWGKKAKDLIIPKEFLPHVDQIWNELLKQQGGVRSSNENITKQGKTIYCEWYNTPLVTETGEVIGVASLASDNTSEHHSKTELIHQEKQQRAILSSMIDGVLTMDDEGKILSCNNAAERITGYSLDEIIGQNIKSLAPESVTSQFSSNNEFTHYLFETHNAEVIGPEVVGVRKDQKQFPMRLSMVQLNNPDTNNLIYIGTFQDLTNIKRQEEQLRRSQKMDALGKLTGGIAHDFNNLLGVIIGYSDLLDKTIEDDSKQSRYSNQIHKAAERGAKLTKKLLGFSRTKRTETTIVDINDTLSAQMHLLEKTLTARIKLNFELDNKLFSTNIDEGDFEDAILNLCINAMHAIEGTGQITIKTSNKVVNRSDANVLQIEAGEYALVQITDSGCGIENTVLERIFDPFFTTKGDEGTGLGLSQVYGFVKNSNGAIKVYSELGHGTQFNLYFVNYDTETITTQKPNSKLLQDLRGTETILVLDDEEPIRLMSEEILEQNGYKVYTAESAEQALQLLKSHNFDLLLSDVIMPKMDGYQFAKIVQKDFPNVKIQLASGFTDDRQNNIKHERYYKQLLQKPYSADTLLTTIRKLLDEKTEI